MMITVKVWKQIKQKSKKLGRPASHIIEDLVKLYLQADSKVSSNTVQRQTQHG